MPKINYFTSSAQNIGSQRPKIDVLIPKYAPRGLNLTLTSLKSIPKGPITTPRVPNLTPRLKSTLRDLKFDYQSQSSHSNGENTSPRGSKLTLRGPTSTPRVQNIDSKMPTIESQKAKFNSQIAKSTPRYFHPLIFQQERRDRESATSFCQLCRKRVKKYVTI